MKYKFLVFLLLFCSIICSNNLVRYSFKFIKNEKCKDDSDCPELNFCKNNSCVHKGILPFTLFEAGCFLLIIIASAFSNAGGIGGGGLIIPILIFLLNFTTHEAIPITKIMIFTGAIITYIQNFSQQNPLRNGVAIDYNIALVIVPFLLFGTMVGVNLNRVLPPFIILLLLTFVLSISSYTTFMK